MPRAVEVCAGSVRPAAMGSGSVAAVPGWRRGLWTIEERVCLMDRAGLVAKVARKVADQGADVPPEVVGQVVDALFGTVEAPGAVAEALRGGEAVTLLGFGSFHADGADAALRPGKALKEYVQSGGTR